MQRNEKEQLSQELRNLINDVINYGYSQRQISDAMKKVRQGADPDTQQEHGWSLLRVLARTNYGGKYNDHINELVNTYKADINIKDMQGRMPLQSMIENNVSLRIVMDFIRLGAHDSKGKPFVNLLAEDEKNISLEKIETAFYLGDEHVLKSGSFVINQPTYIGQGVFSHVFFGKKDNKEIAIKSYKTDIARQTFFAEAGFLIKLKEQVEKSCNVIELIGVDPGIDGRNIILGYASRGTLQSFIEKNVANSVSWQTRYTFVRGMVSGLKFMHDCKIIHCDFKTSNILLDGDNLQIRICDFSNSLNEGDASSFMRTPPAYCAPEVYQTMNHTRASDIFSLGVIIWQIAAWRDIFGELINVIYQKKAEDITVEQIDSVVEGIHSYYCSGKRPRIPLKKPNKTPQKISSIINMCWSGDAIHRPTAPKLEEELSTDMHTQSNVCRQMRL